MRIRDWSSDVCSSDLLIQMLGFVSKRARFVNQEVCELRFFPQALDRVLKRPDLYSGRLARIQRLGVKVGYGVRRRIASRTPCCLQRCAPDQQWQLVAAVLDAMP